MLAAVLKDFDELVLEDVPVPEPGMGEVVVRIRACGVCATDYKAIKGIRRNVTFPFTPGHEPAAAVSSVGLRLRWLPMGRDRLFEDGDLFPKLLDRLLRTCQVAQKAQLFHSPSGLPRKRRTEVAEGSLESVGRMADLLRFPQGEAGVRSVRCREGGG